MKTNPNIIISIDKQFYTENEEVKIHVWLNRNFYSTPILTILSPTGRKIDSAVLDPQSDITQTFVFTCSGQFMFENGYYTIQVESDNMVSESMFEYYQQPKGIGLSK